MERRKFGIMAKALDGTDLNLTLIDTVDFEGKTYFLFVDLENQAKNDKNKLAVRFLEISNPESPEKPMFSNTFSQITDEVMVKKLGEAYRHKRKNELNVEVVKNSPVEEEEDDEEDEPHVFQYVFENEDGDDEECNFMTVAVLELDDTQYICAVCLDELEDEETEELSEDGDMKIYFFEILDSDEDSNELLLEYVEDDNLYDQLFEAFSENYYED